MQLAFLMFASVLLAAPLAAEAQAAGQRHRIGLLNASTPGRSEAAFRESLRALGYVEGGNVVVDFRFAQGRAERLPALVHELLGAVINLKTAKALGLTITQLVLARADQVIE